MATEIFHEFEADAPVTLIPVGSGRLELYANGEKLFDRKEEGGAYPDLRRLRALKQEIKKRIDSA